MITPLQRSAALPGDGLGYRVLGFDKETGDRLDMLRVRPQFTGHSAFDHALRDRLESLADLADPAFARVRRIDRLAGPAPSLVIVSHHVLGVRLAELLSVAESFDLRVDIGTAMALTRQLALAIRTLHDSAPHICHGCIGPERLIVTEEGRLVVAEYILGSALDAMQWPRDKFWYESRIALPATDAPAVFDQHTDILQIGLFALALLEERAVYAERRYPLPLALHVAAARAVPIEGPPQRLSPELTEWLARALQRDRISAFRTIDQALIALDRVIHDDRYDADPSAVADFLARCREASPDLTPRDVDAARESERASKVTLAAITPAPAEAIPAPAPIEAEASSLTQTPATLPPPAASPDDDDSGDPIEFVPVATADESPIEQMNSLLEMEVLVGVLRQPRAPFVVHVDERPLLLVDPVVRSYRVLMTAEPPPIGELVGRLQRGRLRYRDARKDDQVTLGSDFPIELLLWNLGLVLQPDALLAQVQTRGRLHLARWPDFGRIRSDHALLKMSALLTSRSFGITDVFEVVGEPRPRVIAFLNACELCGLLTDAPIEVPSPSIAPVAPAGRPLAGLMQRLRGALGIGRA